MKPHLLFLAVPKCGTTSIADALNKIKLQTCLTATAVLDQPQDGGGRVLCFGTLSYRLLLKQGYVTSYFHQNSMRFAFTRHPYARFLSLWHSLRLAGEIGDGETPTMLIRRLSDSPPPCLGLTQAAGLQQALPQSTWLVSHSAMDQPALFIGKLEESERHWKKLRELSGHKLPDLPKLNVTFNDQSCWKKQFDLETRTLLRKFYAEDFNRLEYIP